MRKIKDIQADIKLIRAEARAAIARLQQEATEVREATVIALRDKRSAVAAAKQVRADAKLARQEAKALKEAAKVERAQAVIAKASLRRQTPAELHCTM